MPEIKATAGSVTILIRGSERYMQLLKKNLGTNLRTNLGTNLGTDSKQGDEAYTEMETFDRVLMFCSVAHSKAEIQDFLRIKSERYVRQNIINPLLEDGRLVRTIPDKPHSPKQRYIAKAPSVLE